MAALLIEAARADGVYDPDEHRLVLELVGRLCGLSPDGAEALHDRAAIVQETAPDVVRFTRVIKTALSENERIAFIETLWSVVLADSRRDANENALLRRLAPLLAVSDFDSAKARQRAIAAIDTSTKGG